MGLPHPYLIFSSILNRSDILFQYFILILEYQQHLLPHIWHSHHGLTWLGFILMHAGGQQLHVIFSFEKKRPSPNYLNRLNDRLNSSQVGLSLSTF